MDVHNDFRFVKPLSKGCGMRLSRAGSLDAHCASVQNEHVVRVRVDGAPIAEMVCSPDHLDELAVGRLLSEGVVRSAHDIANVHVDESGTQVSVRLTAESREARLSAARRKAGNDAPSDDMASTIDTCGNAGARLSCALADARPVTPVPWDPSWVFALADRLGRDTPMHKATFGAHSCMLSLHGRLVCCREDLGRHNAFDKALGHALMHGIDLGSCILFTSGRVPVDMVTKAIRARIPVVASKAVPTNLTLELARTYDLTLICSAHSDSLVVYNDPLGCAERCPAALGRTAG
ncbi:formate dehydrogenase accessory sulfurtransferase FdhD [Xiamenia xianingshaonis]|uniref:Formate dehydrogenase accessory sulfurtransferase FdhD n=1 Tax=Xiamenia xianingshaonis TaxID=2682776 RepID=A0A9E6SUM5_9ACTN|nr:formate dehydrogenase accessory sulfurtransferase FdhD [Xiamenia xianingshaonis]NHM13226.1 formate dehydrogenase accessory sulfurtransferase FdhD [Xiamenia xianingshaonis]QTU84685.1 formate dehydrogenase accessory sulfurtransferase FdhD [Xiamenia xianingshaonis]